MKRLVYIFLIPLLLISCERKSGRRNFSIETGQYDYTIRVVGITDGDTFTGLTRDSIEIRYRIHGIDAPEKKQPFSEKSKQYLSDLIFNKNVGIVVQKKRDRYGRPVVWVYTPEGKDVSAEMIRGGMAWHSKEYSDDEKYEMLENSARDNRIGLWSNPNSVAPWEFRGK